MLASHVQQVHALRLVRLQTSNIALVYAFFVVHVLSDRWEEIKGHDFISFHTIGNYP